MLVSREQHGKYPYIIGVWRINSYLRSNLSPFLYGKGNPKEEKVLTSYLELIEDSVKTIFLWIIKRGSSQLLKPVFSLGWLAWEVVYKDIVEVKIGK